MPTKLARAERPRALGFLLLGLMPPVALFGALAFAGRRADGIAHSVFFFWLAAFLLGRTRPLAALKLGVCGGIGCLFLSAFLFAIPILGPCGALYNWILGAGGAAASVAITITCARALRFSGPIP